MKYYIDVKKILDAIETKDGKRLEQKQLAKLLDVGQQTVSNWKTKGSTKVVKTLLRISEVSGLYINEFISKK